MALAYFKDKFLHESECHISIHDRSFRFGDGIFDTSLVVAGRIYDFESHKQRIEKGLSAYKIDIDLRDLENICYELIAKNSLQTGYIRIIISRGENPVGTVGYMPKGAKPYLLITAAEKPYPAFSPLKLWLSSAHPVYKPPSKTNNSMFYTLAMLEAAENGCDNALLVTNEGNICETASGNIFWLKDGILHTPSLELPIISGTMRAKILSLWEREKQEGIYKLDALKNADEVFMTNIGTLLTPISNINPSFSSYNIGEITKSLRLRLDAAIRNETSAKKTG